ncbi:unnamed protein product [Rhizoctonia solani]|nr:unnamed protein product [Rhizoctonia solani]
MKGIRFNETLLPDGSSKEIDAGFVTVEAGVQWGESYKFADSMDRILIGGVRHLWEQLAASLLVEATLFFLLHLDSVSITLLR